MVKDGKESGLKLPEKKYLVQIIEILSQNFFEEV